MNYRADIDGLRAIAVLSVLLFHLDERFLTGGFVGVDIFFVISGYLITKLIVSELDLGQSFSFRTFYLRRVRRLFPALFFTFLISLVLAYGLFSPQHLASFGESIVYATTSLSNFLFWSQSSYFDQDNLFKPLLHTWSLSIEEQFYFIWPSLLVALYFVFKRKWMPWAILLLGVGSLLLNLYFLFNGKELVEAVWGADAAADLDVRSSMFYLLPFRVFEFVVGAMLVWAPSIKSSLRLNEGLFITGLGMVLYSLYFFDGSTIFPYFNALIPCVGAGLIILSGPDHAFSGLLKNKLMVGAGLISYSLYLIHWPFIVFYNYWKFDQLNGWDHLLIATASILVSMLMYRYVEQPFRKPKGKAVAGESNRPFVITSATLAVMLCLVSWNAYSSSGWFWRYPADVVEQLDFKQGQYTEFFWKEMNEHEGAFANNGKSKVLIVGDSMAADLLNALSQGDLTDQLDIATFNVKDHCRGLLPLVEKDYTKYLGKACLAEHSRLAQDSRLAEADAVILASYWWEARYVQMLQQTVSSINEKFSAKVFIAGVKDQTSNGIYFFTKNISSPHMDKLRSPVHANVVHMNRALANLKGEFEFFTLLDQMCDSTGCQRVTPSGHVIIFDQSHMSPEGAKFVGNKLGETTWFQSLKNLGSG